VLRADDAMLIRKGWGRCHDGVTRVRAKALLDAIESEGREDVTQAE
jgi:hypothetical protein